MIRLATVRYKFEIESITSGRYVLDVLQSWTYLLRYRSGEMMRGTAANRLLSTQLFGPHNHSASLGFDAPKRTSPFAPSDTIIRIKDIKTSHRHCISFHHNSVDAK